MKDYHADGRTVLDGDGRPISDLARSWVLHAIDEPEDETGQALAVGVIEMAGARGRPVTVGGIPCQCVARQGLHGIVWHIEALSKGGDS